MVRRIAVVDLGSNSFRLEIGQIALGIYSRIEYCKETLRQGASLDEDGNLSQEAMERGWKCLARFGEKLADFNAAEVRVVATQTLREAINARLFIKKAQEVFPFSIDVISGQEEARLIYRGVTTLLPVSAQQNRLTLDIGGRSTELTLGTGSDPRLMDTFPLGSLSWSKRYFPDQKFVPKAFEMAEIAAQAVLDTAIYSYGHKNWDAVYGTAGTVAAVSEVLQANGFPPEVVTKEGLDWLIEQLLDAYKPNNLKLSGIREDRKAIIGGGVSILRALFAVLGIERLHKAEGGLRHGLIQDFLSDESGNDAFDMRSKAVLAVGKRFSVDELQATRLKQSSLNLLSKFDNLDAKKFSIYKIKQELTWAANLCEIGRQISHDDYHKHSSYIIINTDADGFTINELFRLGMLVLGHKGKLRKVDAALLECSNFILTVLILRLATLLCHARRDPSLEDLELSLNDVEVVIKVTSKWVEQYPQSFFLLHEEVAYWSKISWKLTVVEVFK